MLPTSCPHLTPSLVPPWPDVPLPTTAPWQPASATEPPRENSSHFYMYVPPLRNEAEQHAMRLVLRANQFPADPAACNRTLVLFDDALTAMASPSPTWRLWGGQSPDVTA